jgi:hypothetical protein
LHVGTTWRAHRPFNFCILLLGRYLFGAFHPPQIATCKDTRHIRYQIWIRFYQIYTSLFTRAPKNDCEANYKLHAGVDDRTNPIPESVGTSWSYLPCERLLIIFLFFSNHLVYDDDFYGGYELWLKLNFLMMWKLWTESLYFFNIDCPFQLKCMDLI